MVEDRITVPDLPTHAAEAPTPQRCHEANINRARHSDNRLEAMRSFQDEEEWGLPVRTVSPNRLPEEGAAHRLSRSGLKEPGSSDSTRYVHPPNLSADGVQYSDFVPSI